MQKYNNTIKRTRYDLTHMSVMCGNLGQLQTRSIVPVVAGDSMKISSAAIYRTSPMRQNMILDIQIDEFIFFVPYRHVYGDNWINFLIQGKDEAITFTTRTLTGSSQIFGTHTIAGQVVPLWLTQGYLNIFNRFFKHPSVVDLAANYFDAIADGDTQLDFGLRCGFIRRIWNSAVDADVTTADYRFALTDGNTTCDLLVFAQTQGLLKSERRREFYAHRYNEIVHAQWGGKVGHDADITNLRPELIYHHTDFLGGMDVMGTDNATLGKYLAVSKGLCGHDVPKKFFNEHGTLWFMSLLRLPPVHEIEINYLATLSQPTYSQIAGDPEIISRQAPITLNIADYILGSALSDAGIVPYAQWYREQNHHVHKLFGSGYVAGHPFLSGTFSTANDIKYAPVSTYAPMFQTTQLAQWQCYNKISIIADRVIPEVSTSIFAGTN